MTIIDIAKESGYSVSTVSRVLNHRQDVSEEARIKIEEIVKKYQFVPNNNAKRLKQSISQNVIILVKGTSNMLFQSIVEEIQKSLEHTDYNVSVSYLDEDEDEVSEALHFIQESKPLGFFFLGGNPEYFKKRFSQVEIPSVLVTTQSKDWGFSNLSSVGTDDVLASKEVMDLFFHMGHRKIAVLGGDPQKSYTSAERFRGITESFAEHKKTFPEENYIKARFSFQSAYDAVRNFLKKGECPTAIFAMSDVMAIGAIRGILDEGLRVPEDISVMGFDGIKLGEYMAPRLATVKQDSAKIAQKSVEILFRMKEMKEEGIHEVIPFEITLGESFIKNNE